MGIIFALGALFAWGFGDFFIQRTTRLIGIWKALFFIGLFGAVGFFPFAVRQFPSLRPSDYLSLSIFSVFVFIFALVNFKALHAGKLSVVLPIISLELVWTVLLSVWLRHEHLTTVQWALVFMIFLGLLLTSYIKSGSDSNFGQDMEKGVLWAMLASVGMGAVNFFFGANSQDVSPVITVWFTTTFAFVFGFLYLSAKKELGKAVRDLKNNFPDIFWAGSLNGLSWLSFGLATTFIAISIATAISQSYIVLTVLLGIFINREKLQAHQFIGIALAVLGVIALSFYVQ